MSFSELLLKLIGYYVNFFGIQTLWQSLLFLLESLGIRWFGNLRYLSGCADFLGFLLYFLKFENISKRFVS